jgi:hypothetical protein
VIETNAGIVTEDDDGFASLKHNVTEGGSTQDFSGVSIYWPIATDPSCYGPECTDDDADIISVHQSEKVQELIEEMAPGAEIEIAMVPTTGTGYAGRPRILNEAGDTLDDMIAKIEYEIERQYVGWMEEALAN